jgi:hypothetical protein
VAQFELKKENLFLNFPLTPLTPEGTCAQRPFSLDGALENIKIQTEPLSIISV